MHEYELLYQRWRRYALRRTLKKSLLALTLLGGGVAAAYFAYTQSKLPAPTTHQQKSVQSHPAKKDHPFQKSEPAPKSSWPKSKSDSSQNQTKKPRATNVITPYFSFESRLVPPPPKPLRLDDAQLMKKPTKPKDQPAKTETERPKKVLIVEEKDGGIKALESKFYYSPSPHAALAIARLYYDQKDYENAAKWALRANSIDKNNEESWLLFAKALAKSGKKQKALSVLEIYAKQSGSKKARELAQKIRSGAF